MTENQITEDIIYDITEKYYATLDYPDFIEIIRSKVIKLNDGTDINKIIYYKCW